MTDNRRAALVSSIKSELAICLAVNTKIGFCAEKVADLALEEAARVAEAQEAHDDPLTAHKIAAAIRAHKSTP